MSPGSGIKTRAETRGPGADAHRSGLEMLVRQRPLVPVVLIVHQVLLHDLVALVKEQVADRAGCRILQVVHWGRKRENRNRKSASLSGEEPLFSVKNSFQEKKITSKPPFQASPTEHLQ